MVDLKWVVRCGWVEDYKWHYSRLEGRDVFVPGTVDRMILRRNDLRAGFDGVRGIELPNDRGLIGLDVEDREDLIRSYFFDKNVPDEHGKHQFEGELRRYTSQRFSCPVSDVLLMQCMVDNYCKSFGLSDELKNDLQKLYDREDFKVNLSN